MVYRKKSTIASSLIGICGSKFHGKDTFAKLVCESGIAGRAFKVEHLADPLKRICSQVFGIDMDFFLDPEKKEAPLEASIVIDLHLNGLASTTGLILTPHNLVARTPRELLQYVGTDYVRCADPEYWLKKTETIIREHPQMLVPDIRFPNEAELVRSLGGTIVKIVRIDMEASSDVHASEALMHSIECDLILGVRTGDLSLPTRVAHLISIGKTKYLKIYDYRNIQNAISLYQDGKPTSECTAALGVQHNDSNAFRFILDYYGVEKRTPGKVSNKYGSKCIF